MEVRGQGHRNFYLRVAGSGNWCLILLLLFLHYWHISCFGVWGRICVGVCIQQLEGAPPPPAFGSSTPTPLKGALTAEGSGPSAAEDNVRNSRVRDDRVFGLVGIALEMDRLFLG